MAAPRVLFIESVHPELSKRLEDSGFVCDHLYDHSRQDILHTLHLYTGVVVRSRITIDQEFLDHAPRLRFIARSGSGLENIDVAEAGVRDIRLFNSPEGNRDAVGEHVTGMLLTLMNRLHIADRQVRGGQWLREENRGVEIAGKTLAIIGYGQMGSSVARKLSGFGCRILAHDIAISHTADSYTELVPMDTIFREADIVSLHLPLTPDTLGYADEGFFQSFRKSIWFVNTARGKHTDTTALANALETGRVRGACLDVLEYEKASLEGLDLKETPHAWQRIIASDRVLLTPHVAGWTTESYLRLSSVLADKILAWWATEISG